MNTETKISKFRYNLNQGNIDPNSVPPSPNQAFDFAIDFKKTQKRDYLNPLKMAELQEILEEPKGDIRQERLRQFKFTKEVMRFENKYRLNHCKLESSLNSVSFSHYSDFCIFNNVIDLQLVKFDFSTNQNIFKTLPTDSKHLVLQADFFKSPMTKNLLLVTQHNGEVVVKDVKCNDLVTSI